jgi:hypothetical protein
MGVRGGNILMVFLALTLVVGLGIVLVVRLGYGDLTFNHWVAGSSPAQITNLYSNKKGGLDASFCLGATTHRC